MEAIAEGYSEGIALDTHGNLSEGSGQNLFLVRDNILYTPPLSAAVLPGITRSSVITLARDLGFTVQEEMLPRELLYIADEAFFVGTAAEITPIRSVDKITIGAGRPGPVTEALQKAFFAVINGEVPDRHGWLTFVYPGEPLQAGWGWCSQAQRRPITHPERPAAIGESEGRRPSVKARPEDHCRTRAPGTT